MDVLACDHFMSDAPDSDNAALTFESTLVSYD